MTHRVSIDRSRRRRLRRRGFAACFWTIDFARGKKRSSDHIRLNHQNPLGKTDADAGAARQDPFNPDNEQYNAGPQHGNGGDGHQKRYDWTTMPIARAETRRRRRRRRESTRARDEGSTTTTTTFGSIRQEQRYRRGTTPPRSTIITKITTGIITKDHNMGASVFK